MFLEETEKKRQRAEKACEDVGRDWKDAATSKELLEPLEAGRDRTDSPLEPSEAVQPC